MVQQRTFVSHSAQLPADRAWVCEFMSGLRTQGLDVFEFAIVDADGNPADITAGATGDSLRVAEIIIHVIGDHPQNLSNFAWAYGVAWVSGRDFVGIMPPGFDPSVIDIPKIDEHFVEQRSPAETVDLVLARIRQPQVV